MLRYALGRLLGIVPTLLVIVTAAFFVMRLAPGGPFDEEQAIQQLAGEGRGKTGRQQALHGLGP